MEIRKNNTNDKLEEIEKVINSVDEKEEEKINWTSAWSKKYPVLANYPKKVNIQEYSTKIRELLNSLKDKYNYSDLDAMLVLKDILYHEWRNNRKKNKN